MNERLDFETGDRSETSLAAPVAVAVDRNGLITTWSEEAERLYGRKAREVLGRPLAEVFSAPGNEPRLQAVFDNALDVILLVDDKARYQDANPAACELLGYEREELLGMSVWDITPEISWEEGRRMWQAFMENEIMIGEYTVLCKDGSTRNMEFRAVANVQPHYHLSILRDVTERRVAEKQLRRHANRTEALASISQALVATPLDTQAVLETITRELSSWIGDAAVLRLFDENGEPITPFAFYHPDPESYALLKSLVKDSPKRLSAELEKQVLRQGRSILVPRVEPHHTRHLFHQRYWEVIEQSSLHSLALVPVRVQGQAAGFLCMARDGRGEPYTEEDLVFMLDIADRAGLTLANAWLYEELEQRVQQRTAELSRINVQLQQEISERQQAEVSEREQRALAQALSNSAAVLNQTLDLDNVLDRILENLENVVPHDVAHVMLREGDEVRVARTVRRQQEPASAEPLRRDLDEMPLMRQMLRTGQGLVISKLSGKQGVHNLPYMEHMHSYAGAPICRDDETIGFLHVGSATPGFYTADHLKWLAAFAQHAAIALHNAQLYQQGQELAALEERQRLARDLHDAVVQTLWSATIIADVLPDLWQQDAQKGLERLQSLRRLTRGALAEMRALLVELRPTVLEEHDLKELLEQLLEAAGSRTRAAIRFSTSGSCRPPRPVQYACYRIAQEALNNISRHAHPSRIELQLVCEESGIELSITDDGPGFDPQQVGPAHMGLSIMRERAAEVNARFRVVTGEGNGTRVQVSWPAPVEE